MKKLILHLPKYRLTVQFKLIKRRKTPVAENLIPTLKTLNLKYRVGGKTQKFLRHIFEHKKVRTILGTNIALMLVASSFVPNYTLGNNPEPNTVEVVNGTENPIKTEVAIQYPTNPVSITQGYRLFHPGIDLDGITGNTIKPIKNGKILSIDRSKFAYGNSIIVDHGAGLTSLYAHLSKINVEVNQTVTTDTKLGEMGATGRSFGDHLHLEVRDHGIPINPLSVLPR